MEGRYPGLWHTWFKRQIAAVGWYSGWGYHLDGSGRRDNGWDGARSSLAAMKVEDLVVAQLPNNRIGRIGEIVRLRVGDDCWDPLVPRSEAEPEGEQGRIIEVRWDLTVGPMSAEMVTQLPVAARLAGRRLRATACSLDSDSLERVRDAMRDETNWTSVLPEFAYERHLSDYISAFPHRLEDGLRPFPSREARELVFSDRTRLDVLLLDRDDNPIVVECKQHAPTIADLEQLRGYMRKAEALTNKRVRGILVHGGSRKLREDLRKEAARPLRIELVQYSMSVGFSPSV